MISKSVKKLTNENQKQREENTIVAGGFRISPLSPSAMYILQYTDLVLSRGKMTPFQFPETGSFFLNSSPLKQQMTVGISILKILEICSVEIFWFILYDDKSRASSLTSEVHPERG